MLQPEITKLRNSYFLYENWGFWDGDTSWKQSNILPNTFRDDFREPPFGKMSIFCGKIQNQVILWFRAIAFYMYPTNLSGIWKIRSFRHRKKLHKSQDGSQIWLLFGHPSEQWTENGRFGAYSIWILNFSYSDRRTLTGSFSALRRS